MDLLERYLQAVGEYLPLATKQDTLAELRENLLARLDARVEELGRPLTEAEVSAILKEHGRPVLVAAPYLPQRYMIGPTVFPFYLMTLRKAAPFVALVYFIAQASTLIFGQGPVAIGPATVRVIAQIIPTMLIFWGIVTLVFAVLELAHAQYGKSADWNDWSPAELPPVVLAIKEKPTASRVADLVLHCLWMGYVFAIPSHPYLVLGPGQAFMAKMSVAFASVWHLFYPGLVALLLVQLGMKLAALAFRGDRWTAPLEVLTKAFGVLLTGFLAFANVYFVPTSSAADLSSLAAVNHALSLGFKIALAAATFDLAMELWKYVRRFAPTERLAF